MYNYKAAKDLPKSHQSYDDITEAGFGYWYILRQREPSRGGVAVLFYFFAYTIDKRASM